MLKTLCLLIVLFLAAAPVAGQSQSGNYWLIKEASGTWEYRLGTGEPRPLTGKYDCLFPDGQVRCLDTDLRRCELRYLTDPRSNVTEKLAVKPLPNGRWISLKGLKAPPTSLLLTASADLAAKFKRVTQAGGSRAASGCGGDFPLKAPACGENIDVVDFKIRWTPVKEDPARKLSILVERVDGRPALFRGATSAASGEFADDKLLDFLRKLQGRNDVVDITIRVMAEGGRSAIRLVHVPPSSKTDQYEAHLREIPSPDPFLRSIDIRAYALEEGMWSKAAEEASRLLALAPVSPDLMEYALAGFCQSDFEEERTRLRSYILKERYEVICASAPSPVNEAPEATPAPVKAVETESKGIPAAHRLGIALLIGNWDYWNLPLNSVKSDLRNMSAVLEALGFNVTVRENLRSPRQFSEALDEVLKKEMATAEDTLLIYYSGHGVQLDGKAHLLGTGVSATAQVADDIRSNAQSAESLLAQMERSIPGTRILILESCRNNVFSSPPSLGGQAPRAGFAFQQDDVPNTFVMFANRPGLPTPARSDYGLMGPFTESLIYALSNSTGEILDVYGIASKKTTEISPGQEPVLHHSKRVDPVVLRKQERKLQDDRARDLLNGAEVLYRDRVWDEFLATVDRGRALASNPDVQQRLNREVEFVRLVMLAESRENSRAWAAAAEDWQKAGLMFPARQWVTMKAAVAWLLADDLARAVQSLAVLTAQSDGEPALQAKQMLVELCRAFPDLETEAQKIAQQTAKVSGQEFEQIRNEE